MKDEVMFLNDLVDHELDVNFRKGKQYEILDENKEFLFIQSKPNTNEVCQIPKTEIGKLIVMVGNN